MSIPLANFSALYALIALPRLSWMSLSPRTKMPCFGLHVKYVLSRTVPSFLPWGVSSSTPIHVPVYFINCNSSQPFPKQKRKIELKLLPKSVLAQWSWSRPNDCMVESTPIRSMQSNRAAAFRYAWSQSFHSNRNHCGWSSWPGYHHLQCTVSLAFVTMIFGYCCGVCLKCSDCCHRHHHRRPP